MHLSTGVRRRAEAAARNNIAPPPTAVGRTTSIAAKPPRKVKRRPPPRQQCSHDPAGQLSDRVLPGGPELVVEVPVIRTSDSAHDRTSRDSVAWTSSIIMHLALATAFWLMLAPKDLGGGDLIELILELQQATTDAEQPAAEIVLAERLQDKAGESEEEKTHENEIQTEMPEQQEDALGEGEKGDEGGFVEPQVLAKDGERRQLSSGGSQGKGGPRASFFGTVAQGDRFVYVLDMSGSMDNGSVLTRFDRAAEELMWSVQQLRPTQSFYVVLFSQGPRAMFDQGSALTETVPATQKNKGRLKAWLAGIKPNGGTDPRAAVQMALRMKPSAVFMLSDGEFNGHSSGNNGKRLQGNSTVFEIVKRQAKDIPIHAIAYEDASSCQQMESISKQTGGQYRFVRALPSIGSSLQQLQDALISEIREEQLAALEVIAKFDAASRRVLDRELVNTAIGLLRHDSDEIRCAAWRALLSLSGGKDFGPTSENPNQDELGNAEAGWQAFFALYYELRDREFGEVLAAMNSGDASERYIASQVVRSWPLDTANTRILQSQLIDLLADEDSDVRRSAHSALVDISGTPSVVIPFDANDVEQIAITQEHWRDLVRLLSLLDRGAYVTFVETVRGDSLEDRETATMLVRDRLDSLDAVNSRVLGNWLAEMLGSDRLQVRVAAHAALVNVSQVSSIPELLEPPSDGEVAAGPQQWTDYLQLLELLESGSCDAFMAKALQNDAAVRKLAAMLILERRDAVPIADRRRLGGFLISLLDDETPVQQAAHTTLKALAAGNNLGPAEDASDADNIAAAQERWTKNWPLVVLLGEMRNWLSLAVQAANSDARREIIRLIDSKRLTFRRPLNSTHRYGLAEPLVELLNHSDPAVRLAARDALVRLSDNVNFGPNPQDSSSEIAKAQDQWRAHWKTFLDEQVIGPQARSALRMADALSKRGSSSSAAQRYQEIMAKYPHTKSAQQARLRLKSLEQH